MRSFPLVLTVFFLLAGGCAGGGGASTAPAAGAQSSATAQEENVLRFTGTVVYVPVEGGFFGIQGDDGRKYDPRNLPEEFRRDKLPVRVVARPVEGAVGFHMWGRIVDIVRIEKK